MTTENEQSDESIDDEFNRFENYQIDMAENEEAKGMTDKTFELAKKSMDEAFQKHPEKCKRILEIIEKYDCSGAQWNNLGTECLFAKLNEIFDTLNDFYYLLVSAKYNSARILLRKWIELVVLSIYFDTTGTIDHKRKEFLEVQQIGYSLFNKKIKKLQDKTCNTEIMNLYKELSLYVHNEGKSFGQFLPFYHEDEFIDISKKVNEIQSLMEIMIRPNCKIKI